MEPTAADRDFYFPPNARDFLLPPQNRAAYSGGMAWVLSQCSKLAYEDRNAAKLEQYLKRGGFNLVEQFGQKDDVTGYLAVHRRNGFAVLAFKGTVLKERKTIWADLRFWAYKSGGVSFHDGFYAKYRDLVKHFAKAVEKIKLPLYVTGHSLGGALAEVTVMRFPYSGRIAACYTYGAPRVCDLKGLVKFYKIPIYRVVHEADLVPSVPLFLQGYVQVGDMRYINDQDELTIGSVGVFRRWWSQVKAVIYLQLNLWIKDHEIKLYSDILKKIAEDRRDANVKKRLQKP